MYVSIYKTLDCGVTPIASENIGVELIHRRRRNVILDNFFSLFRQQSLSQGPSRMTLIRGESCSLVDIPTYISSSIELGCIASPPMQIMMNQQRPTRPRYNFRQFSEDGMATTENSNPSVFCCCKD